MTVSPLHDAPQFDLLPDGVEVREIPFLGQLNLRVAGDAPAVAEVLGTALPTTPCTWVSGGELRVLWLGPDEWLVLTPPGAADEVRGHLVAALDGARGAVTDVSAQRTALSLTGRAAAAVLAKGCSLDLHPSVRGRGTCVQTLLAQAGVIVVVNDDAAADFLLLVRSSFARYVADWIADAAVEPD